MRHRGAMDSTLISRERNPSSNPGRNQRREEVIISEGRSVVTSAIMCGVHHGLFVQIDFFFANLAFLGGKIGFLYRPYLSGNSIEFLPLLFLPGYRRISPLLPYNFILRTSRLSPNQYFNFLPLFSRLWPEPPVGSYAGIEWDT